MIGRVQSRISAIFFHVAQGLNNCLDGFLFFFFLKAAVHFFFFFFIFG